MSPDNLGSAEVFEPQAAWRNELILTDKKKPKALLANAIIALRRAPQWQGSLRYDAFHQRTVIKGRLPWAIEPVSDIEWSNVHDIRTAEWMQHQEIYISPDVAGQAAEAVAAETRFHPVLDYLAKCVWDGEPRLDTWAVAYLGAQDSPCTRAVASRWMMSAVARVTEPGCKADCALILEGRQGILKPTALKTIGQPWFTDEIADLGTKDASLQLAGAWILEIAELDSLSRSDVAKIKAFMSRTADRFRPPYGRRVIEVPRQCVFAGTVNNNEYLRDETGGRRFWPIDCAKVDINGLREARDQLWAEARDRYLAGEAWWLDTIELNVDAGSEQRARYQADPWEESIREWLLGRTSVSVSEVLEHVIGLRVSERGQVEMNRVARCIRALGWERHQERDGIQRVWRYRRSVTGVTGGGEGER